MYADVIIDISHEQLDKTFQYAVPDELADVIELGMSVDIPFGAGNRQITGYVVGLGDKAAYPVEKIKYIKGITEGKVTAVSRMLKLAAWLKHNYGCTMNQAIKTVIPVKDKVKQKEKRSVNLIIDEAQAQKYLDTFAKKNAKARYRLLEALIKEPVIDESIIKSKLNITAQTVKAFEDMGIAEVRSEDIYRNPVRNVTGERKHIELNKQQKNAVDTIIADYDNGDYKTYLLHGVTGSGKTEVYLEAIEHVLNKGRQAIVLIPEIALTFQTVQRFYHRFGDTVSIMNSRMSKGERYDQFLRAQRGDISVMIGPRSALFTPFSNIGLIVIDEEHEGAYKSETVPRYHAREVACHIAREAGASVILGSATPSMESYYAAMNGHIELIKLDSRAGSGKLPAVDIVDLREELRLGNRTIFSNRLRELMSERLAKHEQIMLFLNKRGVAGFISCRSCGKVMKCPHCDVSLTEHADGRLMCHYCGYSMRFTQECPSCHKPALRYAGFGTQRIEDELEKAVPGARIMRMDTDTASSRFAHEECLNAFARGDYDILVGTQMVAKGLNFENVTLAAVVSVDQQLYNDDFRSLERTFSLLTQVVGRSGRGEHPGKAIIQTLTPENEIIRLAAKQDYDAFYDTEIRMRRLMIYPPFCDICVVGFSGADEVKTRVASQRTLDKIKELTAGEYKNEKLIVLGPLPARVPRVNKKYRYRLIIKCRNTKKFRSMISEILKDFYGDSKFSDVSVYADMNPEITV